MRLNWRCSSPWPAALDRNVKDWVSTKANGADSSRSNMPTRVGVGYSLMPSIAATRVARRQAVLDRLGAEQQPRGRQRLAHGPARQRHAPPFAVDQQRQKFQQRRVPDAARCDSCRALPARSAPARRAPSAPASRRPPAPSALRSPSCASAGARRAAVEHRPAATPGRRAGRRSQIELVHHQRLAAPGARGTARRSAAANPRSPVQSTLQRASRRRIDVRPERNVRAGEVAPQDIQALVPVIELLIVRALEARTAQAKHLQVVAEHVVRPRARDMRACRECVGRDAARAAASLSRQPAQHGILPRRRRAGPSVGAAAPAARVRQIERQRAVAARLPEPQIGEQRRQRVRPHSSSRSKNRASRAHSSAHTP